MASKKTTPAQEIPVNEAAETEVKQAEGNEAEAKLKAQQAEIEKLKAQLAEAQKARKPGMQQDDAAIVKQAAKEACEKGKDPWQITVNIRAPRKSGKDDPWYWLNVNGRSVQVPADDKFHELKLPWAETLINSLEAEKYAEDFQDKLEVYDPVTNPH